ncbi:hypothetical protein MSAN_02091500 [Mycena sanguinolenta]|uniref:Uncharacterized protein n=1 Tax=Mycena sanguinolenta TaxID=230812 RepID=A0A8H6XGI0_9AGAR|nr:hypothetical protein MSAN_02091500 [Mycena sanguinolenta]
MTFSVNFISFDTHSDGSNTTAPLTLLLLDKDRQFVKRWEVVAEHVDGRLLSRISFVPGDANAAWNLLASHQHKRVLFWVNNLRSDNCVLVFQAVRATLGTVFVCPGTVWLKGKRQCFIIEMTPADDSDITLIATFRLYRLRLDSSIHATHGRLALRSDRAQAVSDVYLTLFNPTGMKHNWVSALPGIMPRDWDGPIYGFREAYSDVYHDDNVGRQVNLTKVYQKESKEVSGLAKLRYDIGGSDNPEGSVDVYTP